MSKYRVLTHGIFITYIIGITALMIWQGVALTADRFAIVFLLYASLIIRKTRSFLFDWIPFMLILFSYEFLRGFSDNLGQVSHIQELIYADKILFGFIPTIELQKYFFNPKSLKLYDYIATIIYLMHFVLPETFAFILWVKKKAYFRQFVIGLLLLSYGGLLTYAIYPATPPWLANEQGSLPGVEKIMFYTSQSFTVKFNIPTLYYSLNPNLVAAIPSLHAAYSTLVLLFALSFFGRKALLILPYVLAVWLSIVYLGEHYVIDVIIGIIYAVIFFAITKWVAKKYPWSLT